MSAFSLAPSRPEHSGALEAMTRAANLVAPALDRAVERLTAEIQGPVGHHLQAGGKRVRAAITVLSAAACGGTEEDGVVGAVAVELVHNFSLLHDDIIDGDRERRHRPTVWAEYGVGAAIIAGDALAALSLQVLLDEPTPERVRAAAALAGATQAMIAGQADDMAFESRSSVTPEECLAMETAKTGALLSCASEMGAVLAGASDPVIDAMARYGRHVGIAFQAVDDLLGIWGEPSRTGKPVGNDLLARKKSLPIVLALAHADEAQRAELRRLLDGDLAEPELRRASELIEECGARAEVNALAEAHLAAALGALGEAGAAPGPGTELAAIARFVTERDL